MAPEKTLRHVEALVKDILEASDAPGVLRRALEAALAAIMEAEVAEQAGADITEPRVGRAARRRAPC
jgi:hypothetical protein